MKKLWKKIAVVCLLLFVISTLTGCSAGSTINTVLYINSDFSGKRVMTIALDDSVFSQNFHGTIDDLNAAIGEACPSAFSWEYGEPEGVKTYTVTLEFSSVDDYISKVQAITESEPTIVMTAPDSVWANGLYVEESFNSEELLEWMKQALVDKGLVDSGNAGKIFTTGDTKVNYSGEDYYSGSRVNVNEIQYVSLDRVDVLTAVHGVDVLDRKVVFYIPNNSMQEKGTEIKDYLKSVTPSNAAGEWSEGDYDSIYTIEAKGLTADDLAAMDKMIFSSDDTGVWTEDITGDREAVPAFGYGIRLDESINLSAYLVEGYTSTYYGYYVAADDNIYAEVNRYEGYDNEQYPGYKELETGRNYGETIQLPVQIKKVFPVDNLSVETKYSRLSGKWTRTSKFALSVIPQEDEWEKILNKLEKRGSLEDRQDGSKGTEIQPQADSLSDGETEGDDLAASVGSSQEETAQEEDKPKYDIKISGKEDDGKYVVILTQKGDYAGIAASSELLFDFSGRVGYAKDQKFWHVKKLEVFEEEVNYGDFLSYVTENFKLNYTLKIGMFAKQVACEAYPYPVEETKAPKLSGSKLSYETDETSGLKILYTGTRIDFLAVVFWLLIVAGAVCVVIAVVKSGVLGKIMAKKPAAMAGGAMPMQNPTAMAGGAMPVPNPTPMTGGAASAQNPAPASETPKLFCEGCGAKREGGAVFCVNCGRKFE